ncbi:MULTISPECIES: hypothetical protein [unclassified Terrabacter]|uniref:hypothetical protein n=1 Tax=unclassified Terrabacter TaxID=2630222 RepID=UPI0006F2DD3F|nr:hypothetical protein ASD90_02325 [Terrabacter sp. Root181]KRF38786.1 hypothetical protein ASG96_15445 [Terrabacter sp. Soil810]
MGEDPHLQAWHRREAENPIASSIAAEPSMLPDSSANATSDTARASVSTTSVRVRARSAQ